MFIRLIKDKSYLKNAQPFIHSFLIKRLPSKAGTKGFHGSTSFRILRTRTGCENKAGSGKAVESEKGVLGNYR